MKGIWYSLLLKVAGWITSPDFVNRVKDVVLSLFDKTISGEQKRKKAIKELKEEFKDMGSSLINMVIEIVVNYIKAKSLKSDKG